MRTAQYLAACFRDAGALPTRLLIACVVFGIVLSAHGGQKLFGWFGGSSLTATGGSLGGDNSQPLPAGDAPAFLLASVQPLNAPASWRRIYHEVEQCVGRRGDYDAIRWGVMEAPLQGPKGPTYAFTVGRRIVLVRGDTTYLKHEMLHHILEISGWHPHALKPGEHHTIADLHPLPAFGQCTGGH